jgi:hypothetical protein
LNAAALERFIEARAIALPKPFDGATCATHRNFFARHA